jgi:7-cyano-7-deazaguanine reductase
VEQEFVSLGKGSDTYGGLETFPNPGVAVVALESDELTAMCPITNQPDNYVATIRYRPDGLCLETKSVKLYLAGFRNEGAFCEALAVRIRDDVAAALELEHAAVEVTLVQKRRGGIEITASV